MRISFGGVLLVSLSGASCTGGGSTEDSPARAGSEPPRSIAEETPGFYQDVSWAPDERRLAISVLESAETPEGFQYRVFVINADGTDYHPITAGPMDYWVSWSPDGSQIAFSGRQGDNVDIYVIDADGTNRRRLTRDPGADLQPAWSPEGDRLAFISNRGGREELFVMDSDGAGKTRVFGAPRDLQNPTWSGDGQSLAFFLTDGETDSVAVVGVHGSDLRVIAAGVWPSFTRRGILFGARDSLWLLSSGSPDAELIEAGAEFGRVSPNGTLLAFVATDEASVSVRVRSLDSDSSRVLLTRPLPPFF